MTTDLARYMKSDTALERFAQVVGDEHGAMVYVSSVLLAVANGPERLKSCTNESIFTSALRAATLRLSVDQAGKQAYIVPYGKTATLLVGWKGLYDMAMRTGKYRFINASKIKAGMTVLLDPFSGQPSLEHDEKSTGGWVASFELSQKWGGMQKTVYMSHEEIQEHKLKYAKGHDRRDSAWNTNLEAMEKKTVLRNLLTNWGIFDAGDMAVMAEIEAEQDAIEDEVFDVEAEQVEEESEQRERVSGEEALSQMGY